MTAQETSSPAVRIVIYGTFSPNWTAALAPDAPVWKAMPGIKQVLLVPNRMVVQIPPPDAPDVSTVVIPLLEEHTLNCPGQYLSLIPDRRSVEILGNKAAFAAYAKAIELTHLCPKTYESIADAVFPCVVKIVDLNSGNGVTIVPSLQYLQALLAHETWRGRRFVLQAIAKGATDYVTHCVCQGGRILWHCSFAFEMETPETIRNPRNAKTVRRVETSQRNLTQIEAFLAPLAYTGPCNVDYKLSEDGDLVVFEINPRLGGSLMQPETVEYLRQALSVIIETAIRKA